MKMKGIIYCDGGLQPTVGGCIIGEMERKERIRPLFNRNSCQ